MHTALHLYARAGQCGGSGEDGCALLIIYIMARSVKCAHIAIRASMRGDMGIEMCMRELICRA